VTLPSESEGFGLAYEQLIVLLEEDVHVSLTNATHAVSFVTKGCCDENVRVKAPERARL
jgi:hypothetical protein